MLQDDVPKQDPWREDRLGFAAFAERLSKVIVSLEAPNGYVIGLHGKWGSGKSTALNFLNAFLKKHNDEAVSEWPAPGSEDTELGVLMEPEVDHGETEVYTRVQT
jgi:ABC-type Na+ transport system ATPase subunit NatA